MKSGITKETIKEEVNHIPDRFLAELYEYMVYLKRKGHNVPENMDTAYASEYALAKDWNNPEEDQAWADL